MELGFFVKGMILGFSIAAPVGPIGVLCIRRTIQYGRWSGFFSGMGAAVADTLYGMIAALGLTWLSGFMVAEQFWFRVVGGAFLLYLGIKTFRAKPMGKGNEVTHKTLTKDFASTFFLTMTNPMTIISYLAIFAGLGLTPEEGSPTKLILGVFFGSAIWWIILSEGVTLFRSMVSERVMTLINRFAGALIAAFGIAAWLSLL